MISDNTPKRWPGVAPILAAIMLSLLQAACGGGGGSDNSATAPAATGPTNLQALTIGPGPAGGVNLLYTSIVLCTPGDATSCRTIDHVLVDTGSVGLRLLASAVPSILTLAQRTTGDAALVECMQFADGFSWGPLKTADIRLGGEVVRSAAVQIIGDPAFSTIPAACSATGASENTVATFGSNGVLGVGNFANDCGDSCARSAAPGLYYACNASGCTGTRLPLAQQIQHPVSLMAVHNNGVLLRLPAVDPEGAVGVTGSLVFGIGTETNNGLNSARVYTVDPTTGTLPISTDGVSYPNSFIDSGSNATFFPSTIARCTSGYYCPQSTRTIAAVLQSMNGNNAAFSFSVANAEALFREHPTFGVLPKLAGPGFGASAVDLGLPFFLGRSVYTAIEERQSPGGMGPYIAF